MKFLQNFNVLICGAVFVLIHLFTHVNADSVEVVELMSDWKLANQNMSLHKTRVKLPSGVYSALYSEKVLQSYNDVAMRWISYDNWTYTRTFPFSKSDFSNVRHVNLTFHGIDTVAEIRLNHMLLGRTDNMFVRYTYDVTHILEEDNLLEVEIKSPIYAALARANALEERNITIPPNCPPKRYNGECHMNMLRKMQASFAWDWGLAAPSMGIWRSVTLEYYEAGLIRDIDVVNSKNATHWNMHIRVFIDVGGNRDFFAELKFYAVELLKDPVVISDYVHKRISRKAAVITFDQAIPINDVRTWWPNGYGEQKLYPLHFTLNTWLNDKGPNIRAKTISTKSIRIGFRTIELVETEAPGGNTFLFRINGEEIFMKGANYIPLHILPELSEDHDKIKHLLLATRDAHMNMIRIWGGGIYESDYFYDMADYLGILIWQDMMFACAMYPATDEFLTSVRQEVVQNAKRIGYHPSVAIFATNNENEAALVQNWYGTISERKRFDAEYRELYLGTVMHELKILENSIRPTPLVSSPSNGKESAKDNFISPHPQDPNYGDVHFYDVFKDGWDPNTYPRPRFASEYGHQSLPKLQSWRKTLGSKDELIELIYHRQHHPMGMIPILTLISRHLPLPVPEDEHYAEALIYFSQIAQAMAVKIETELYRSLRDTEHRTMGALYWQLNDVWVAPSWSSIDFYGNYKLLHHWAKEFMAPIAIVALYDSKIGAVNVTLICDHRTVDTNDLTVTLNTYLWSNLYPKKNISWSVILKPNGVQYDKLIPVRELLTDGFTKTNCFFEFILQRDSELLSRTYYFPDRIESAVGVQNPDINLDVDCKYCNALPNGKINSCSLTITVKYPAIFVYLEAVNSKVRNYKLSRNGFMQVMPVQVVHLEFVSSTCVNLSRDDIKILTVNEFMH